MVDFCHCDKKITLHEQKKDFDLRLQTFSVLHGKEDVIKKKKTAHIMASRKQGDRELPGTDYSSVVV